MSNVYDSVHMLIKSIYESTQYSEYKQIEAELNQDTEAKRRLNEFRNKRFILEEQKLKGISPSEEQVKNLQEDYSSLMMNPGISSFIRAELTLSEMILEIYNNISDALDFDLDFIQDI